MGLGPGRKSKMGWAGMGLFYKKMHGMILGWACSSQTDMGWDWDGNVSMG